MSVTIYGASDDLVEVDGDVREEFTYLDHNEEGDLLAFSDGTVIRIWYTSDGLWRIAPLVRGATAFSIVPAVLDDDDNYSDRATLTGDLTWVVQGVGFATR